MRLRRLRSTASSATSAAIRAAVGQSGSSARDSARRADFAVQERSCVPGGCAGHFPASAGVRSLQTECFLRSALSSDRATREWRELTCFCRIRSGQSALIPLRGARAIQHLPIPRVSRHRRWRRAPTEERFVIARSLFYRQPFRVPISLRNEDDGVCSLDIGRNC